MYVMNNFSEEVSDTKLCLFGGNNKLHFYMS